MRITFFIFTFFFSKVTQILSRSYYHTMGTRHVLTAILIEKFDQESDIKEPQSFLNKHENSLRSQFRAKINYHFKEKVKQEQVDILLYATFLDPMCYPYLTEEEIMKCRVFFGKTNKKQCPISTQWMISWAVSVRRQNHESRRRWQILKKTNRHMVTSSRDKKEFRSRSTRTLPRLAYYAKLNEWIQSLLN